MDNQSVPTAMEASSELSVSEPEVSRIAGSGVQPMTPKAIGKQRVSDVEDIDIDYIESQIQLWNQRKLEAERNKDQKSDNNTKQNNTYPSTGTPSFNVTPNTSYNLQKGELSSIIKAANDKHDDAPKLKSKEEGTLWFKKITNYVNDMNDATEREKKTEVKKSIGKCFKRVTSYIDSSNFKTATAYIEHICSVLDIDTSLDILEDKIYDIKQGSLSVSEYYAKFMEFACCSELSERKKAKRFYIGLNDSIKEGLDNGLFFFTPETTVKRVRSCAGKITAKRPVESVEVSKARDNPKQSKGYYNQKPKKSHVNSVENSEGTSSGTPTRKSNDHESKQCSNCGRKGHVLEQCWARGGPLEGTSNGGGGRGSTGRCKPREDFH
jgi:hypothetical protein